MASYTINSMFEPNDLFEVYMSLLALAQKAKTKGLQSGMDSRVKYLEKQERNFQYATMYTASASSGSKQTPAGVSARWA